jgi:hypothetical protein
MGQNIKMSYRDFPVPLLSHVSVIRFEDQLEPRGTTFK